MPQAHPPATPPTHASQTPAPRGGLRTFVMPAVVLGFLGGHMLFIVIAISLAVGDRSFAVVPDYYQKAVEWDEHKAALRASAALGWSVDVQPSRDVSVRGERDFTVVLHDDTGAPITDARVTATLYHHARASRVVEATLAATDEPGRYTATAAMRDEGVWDITLHITHGETAYLHEEKQFVRGRATGGRP